MTNNGIVNIHSKEYMAVVRMLELTHEDKVFEGVKTEVLNHNPVVVKAEISVKGKIYTRISSVNPDKVAGTSAIGYALGFAGYGLIESVASADEVSRATAAREPGA